MGRDALAVFVIEIKQFYVISPGVDVGTSEHGRVWMLRWQRSSCQLNIHGLGLCGSVD